MPPRSRYPDNSRGYPYSEDEELETGEPIPEEEEERPATRKAPRARPTSRRREDDEDQDNRSDRSERPAAPGGRMVLSSAKYLQKNTDPEIERENRRRREAEASMRNSSGGPLATERGIINSGMAGGTLAMIGAVVWFVIGLSMDVWFIYPPVLFVLGFVAFLKGMAKGK